MSDINCPYCDCVLDIDHDDGKGYAEDRLHEQQCRECDKYFVFSTVISYDYYPEKADCLNGGEHLFKNVIHYPAIFPEWVRCETCEKEIRGKYREVPLEGSK